MIQWNTKIFVFSFRMDMCETEFSDHLPIYEIHNSEDNSFKNEVYKIGSSLYGKAGEVVTLANTHSVDNMNSLVDFLTWLGSR